MNEPSDKHRLSTACRSGNHTDKRMDPWHEMTRIVFIGDVKCVRIVGLCHVIRFYFITMSALLLLLLLWGKRVWLLLLWDKRVWLLLLLLLLWSKRVWLLLLKYRLLLTCLPFSGVLNLHATHRYYCIDYKYYSCCFFGCWDTTD